jgi:putative methionine-R-sulfoxide reductase with GAF domain
MITFYFNNIHFSGAPDSAPDAPLNLGVAGLLTAAFLVLGNLMSDRILRPLWEWYLQATEAAKPEKAPLRIRGLALNMPAISAGVTLSVWFLAGLAFGVMRSASTQTFNWSLFFQIMLGTGMAGSVTTVLAYFATERIWRSELPLFFVEEDLTETPAFRLKVRMRMLILFIMGTVPLLNLAALSYNHAVQIAGAAQPTALLPGLLYLELFLAGSGILAAVVLARTLGASLVEPLETLSQRMTAVEKGDLDVQMTVTSNDEIGVMSECFNGMVESLKRRNMELQTVYQISQEIAANLELDQAMQTTLGRVRQMIAYDGAGVCLYDEEEDVLRAQAWAGPDGAPRDTDGRSLRLGEGYAGWVGENRQSLLVADVDAHQEQQSVTREIADGVVMSSYLGTPLVAGEKLVGTLELVSARRDAFDEHARQLLETIAPQAAIAIENAVQVLARERRLREQIEQLRIEINEVKRARQVAEVTETEYFQRLQKKAQQIRAGEEPSSEPDTG